MLGPRRLGGPGASPPRDDLAAAELSGVAMSVLDGFQAIEEAGLTVERLRVTGGGSREPRFAQFLCDLLGVPFDFAGRHAPRP